jgi:hypothetical protein
MVGKEFARSTFSDIPTGGSFDPSKRYLERYQ